MKVFIVYDSKYGNGKKCVEYLQGVISKKGHDVKAFSVHGIPPKSLTEADLYIFSSPTHMKGPTWKMKRFLKKLDISQTGGRYSLMTTHMAPEIDINTIQVMEDILESKGFKKVSGDLRIKVTGIKGPLESGYEKKIDDFVNTLFKN
ncbi:MAG: flavodoxin domain-containing protein [Candidatus Thermoplasmatota archaeon]|nr:flavodoxin domain-containing protein [Candidatus Thermoplasmatota archaeon]